MIYKMHIFHGNAYHRGEWVVDVRPTDLMVASYEVVISHDRVRMWIAPICKQSFEAQWCS